MSGRGGIHNSLMAGIITQWHKTHPLAIVEQLRIHCMVQASVSSRLSAAARQLNPAAMSVMTAMAAKRLRLLEDARKTRFLCGLHQHYPPLALIAIERRPFIWATATPEFTCARHRRHHDTPVFPMPLLALPVARGECPGRAALSLLSVYQLALTAVARVSPAIRAMRRPPLP